MNLSASIARISPETTLTTGRGQPVVVRRWRGEGSYARVYEGAYGPSAQPCAVKLAKGETPGAAERLLAEQTVLQALHHPRIVSFLDGGRRGELPYEVLEWLEGESVLDTVNARRRLPLRQSLEILEAVADGLAHVHEHGLVHGDIRPQNIVLVPRRGAVLTDPGATPLPSSGNDIRAAGALFYWMLTGEDPSRGAARLTPTAGYSKSAVHLWERLASEHPPTAPEMLDQVRRARRSL